MRNGIDYVIKVFTNKHPDFYRVMGPYLSRREIVAETGFPIWDDDCKTWLVAMSGREVLGFCSYESTTKGKLVRVGSDYVVPSKRNHGVYRGLFMEREQLTDGWHKRAVATASSLPLFVEAGYETIKTTKNYSILEKR